MRAADECDSAAFESGTALALAFATFARPVDALRLASEPDKLAKLTVLGADDDDAGIGDDSADTPTLRDDPLRCGAAKRPLELSDGGGEPMSAALLVVDARAGDGRELPALFPLLLALLLALLFVLLLELFAL